MGAAIDGADRRLAREARSRPPEIESQAADAVLKALGLAWFAHATGTGDPTARVEAFRALPAGRSLLALWATVDVALPLGGTDVARMVSQHRDTETIRWVAIGGERAVDGIVPIWEALVPTLQKVVDTAAKRTESLAAVLAPFVPGLIPTDGGATPAGASEQIALQSDRMPIYKWLAARLAAEHAVSRATAGA
jgi:hypothetical protein